MLTESCASTIVVENVSKKYVLRQKSAAERANEFWALNNISFTLAQGDKLGIIGANGSGKTTLLKLLSQIIKPSEGNIKICGQVLSIIDLGASFHPDLSGKENILLVAQVMLGMNKKTITAQLKKIIAFSELEDFIEEPVKNYSNGMYLRLAISIAFFCPANILLIDEIFSAGDKAFLLKCQNKMNEAIKEFQIMVFATHNMDDILRVCNKCIWLDTGSIKMIGDPEEIISSYNKSSKNALNNTVLTRLIAVSFFDNSEAQNKYVNMVSASISNSASSNPSTKLDYNLPLNIKIRYEKKIDNCEIGFSLVLTDDSNNSILSSPQYLKPELSISQNKNTGLHEATCIIPEKLLNIGVFSINLRVLLNRKEKILYLTKVLVFEIISTNPAQENILKVTPMKLVPTLEWENKYVGTS